MRKSAVWALSAALLVLQFLSNPAQAADGVSVCTVTSDPCQGTGDDGSFHVGGSGATPAAPGKGGGGSSTVDLAPTYYVYEYAPTCTGNTREDANVLCGAAVNTCQPTGKGIIRYWVYRATYVRATHAIDPAVGWQLVATQCIAPDDPALPGAAAVVGIVQRDFKDLVVVKGTAHVQPRGKTLVNYDNGFWTEAAKYVLPPVQVLGHRVVVTATPSSYDWYFGDGTSALDAGPGRAGTRDVHHAYTATGTVSPHVVITWTGTFTVDGGGAIDVIGTAQTTGDGTPLQVREARAQLVG